VNKNIQNIIKGINELAEQIDRNINLMEVCGTHTQAVARHGLRRLMPKNVRLTTGPGCPVCVTAQEDIDAIVGLASAGIPVATYGDMLRVPGFFGSLDEARSGGAEVFEVYSTEDALALGEKYPELVFFGLGFETTAPMTAYAVKKGLTTYSTHKLFLPAMKALLAEEELKIDGFLNPGHVSAIIGVGPYKEMKAPQVIAGFEAEDILAAVYMLLKQIKEGRADVENEYSRAVRPDGNPAARRAMFDVFDIKDGLWRGFGIIPESGLEIKKKYKNQDAKIKYKSIIRGLKIQRFKDSKIQSACRCGEIIRGLKNPKDCPMFKKACHPEKPFGPCMVSTEGACNVEYRYAK